jgi:protein gp37
MMARARRRGGRLDWVVVGGESGPGARPFEMEWGTQIVEQCRAAKVPVFVKQVGARPLLNGQAWRPHTDSKGGDMACWPEFLRVREFPEVTA